METALRQAAPCLGPATAASALCGESGSPTLVSRRGVGLDRLCLPGGCWGPRGNRDQHYTVEQPGVWLLQPGKAEPPSPFPQDNTETKHTSGFWGCLGFFFFSLRLVEESWSFILGQTLSSRPSEGESELVMVARMPHSLCGAVDFTGRGRHSQGICFPRN